jgi:hypothetical protein
LGAGPFPAAIAFPASRAIPITKHAAIAMVLVFILFHLERLQGVFFLYGLLEIFRIFGSISKKNKINNHVVF